ncbi:MAG: Asp-tRNA(Asn)/Glu-tRNA(Gln) amidotransferase subunit GatB [Bdellovibrionales bacterium]|nr:Asp-tRNA(Asn)/Glu-tRNA(Gln) amidotransferase subunit GatB [Bdellovibrionales bacterium]
MTAPSFEAVIGLEVHCQLSTATKIFCSCPARPPEGVSVSEIPANRNICEVCCGHPGALPVMNSEAVKLAIRAGVAVGSTIRHKSLFSRKNYFYPDLPKGYQISQYETAICEGGGIYVESKGQRKLIRLRRIHLEEDAGKSVHEFGVTLVNLNRAGVPLVEIVGEPDLSSPEEAGDYLRELHAIVTCLGITDGNMQEGNFRCDANVSIRPAGTTELGTRVEIKNVNSFRFVEKALEFEIQRQIAVVSSGKQVVQETRLYDPQKDQTFPMRTKEEAEDYRYFPDPDLMPLIVAQEWIEFEKSHLPELPAQKRARYLRDFALSDQDARYMTAQNAVSQFFENVISQFSEPARVAKMISNLISGEISRLSNESSKAIHESQLTPKHLAQVVELLSRGKLSSTAAKKVLNLAWTSGEAVDSIIQREGLTQENDASALEPLVAEILAQNTAAIEELRSGKEKVMGFLVGQVMRRSSGRGNPAIIQDLIRKQLGVKTKLES